MSALPSGNARPDDALPPVDAARHARQIALPDVGPEGQARLRRARVLLVGAFEGQASRLARLGALGAAAAGVVRVSNLVGGIDRWSDEVDPGVPRY